MCEHLLIVEQYIIAQGIPVDWRGQPWTQNCREWVYFDCRLDAEGLRVGLKLDDCVQVHNYNDIKAGAEFGLICDTCKDGVMGVHPDASNAAGKRIISWDENNTINTP